VICPHLGKKVDTNHTPYHTNNTIKFSAFDIFARNFRWVKYGKALLRMFVKKPIVALKAILRSSEGKPDNPTLPTDLSVLRDETTGQMITNLRR
jgi:hypothetical protein